MFYIVRDNYLGDLYANMLGVLNRDLDCNYGGNVNYVSSYLFVRAASLPISAAAFVAQYLYDDREAVSNYDKYFVDFGLQLIGGLEMLYRGNQTGVFPFVSHLMWTVNCANLDFDSISVVDLTSFLAVNTYDHAARDVVFLRKHFNDAYGRMNKSDVFYLKDSSAYDLANLGLMGDFRVSAIAANSLFDVGYGDKWVFATERAKLIVQSVKLLSLVALSKSRVLPLMDVDSMYYGVNAYIIPAMHVVAQRSGFGYPQPANGAFSGAITSETIASMACSAFNLDNRFIATKMYKLLFTPKFHITDRQYSIYDLFAMMQAYAESYNETVFVGYNEFCKHFSRFTDKDSFGFGSIAVYLLTKVKPNIFLGFNYSLPVVNINIKKLLEKTDEKTEGYEGVLNELQEYSKGLEYILFKLMSDVSDDNKQHIASLLFKYKLADMRKAYSSIYYDEVLYVVEHIWDQMSQHRQNEDKLVGKFMPEERKSLYKLNTITGVDLSIVEYTDLSVFDRGMISVYYNMQYTVAPVITEFNIMPKRFIGIMLTVFSLGHITEKISLILRKSTIDQIPKNMAIDVAGKPISVIDGMPTDGVLMYIRRHFIDMYLSKLNSFIDINWLLNPYEESFEYGNFVARHCYVDSMYLDKFKSFGYSPIPSYDSTFSLITFLLNRTGVVSCGTLSINDGVKNLLLYDMVNRMLPNGAKMPTSLFKEVVKNMPEISVRIGGSKLYIEIDPKAMILGTLANCTEYYKSMSFSSVLTTESVIILNEMQDGYLKHSWLEYLVNSIITAFVSPYISGEWFNIGVNERFPVAVLSSYFVPYGDYRSVFASHIPATVQHNMDPGYLSLFNSHVSYGHCGDGDNDLVDSYNNYVVKIPFTNSLFSSCLDSVRAQNRNYWLNIGRSHLMTAGISDRTMNSNVDHNDVSLIQRLYFSPITDILRAMDNDYEIVTWIYFKYSQGLPRYLNFNVVVNSNKQNVAPLIFNFRDMLFHVFSSQIMGCSCATMICNNTYTGSSYAASFVVRQDDQNSFLVSFNSLRPYQFVPSAPFERLLKPMFLHAYFHYTTYHYNVAGLASSVYWINSMVCAFAAAGAYIRAHKYKSMKELGLNNSLKRKPSNGLVIMQKFYNYKIIDGKFHVCEEGSSEIGIKINNHIITVDFGGVRRFLRASILGSLFNYDIHGFNTGVNLPTSVPTTTILVLFNAIIESIVGYNTIIGGIVGNNNQRQHRSIVALKRYRTFGDDIIEYTASLGPMINDFGMLNFVIFVTCAVEQSTARYKRGFNVNMGDAAPMINNNALCVFLSMSEFIDYSVTKPIRDTVQAVVQFGFNVVNSAYELATFAYTRLTMSSEDAMRLYEGVYTQEQIDKLKEDIETLKAIREEAMKALEENIRNKNKLQEELEKEQSLNEEVPEEE